MPFRRAGQAEIIRSHQKDDFYLNYLRSSAAEVAQGILGARIWLSWRQELDVLADLGYFLLTTCAGYQTVGEEYVNIVQVDGSQRAIPSTLSRTLMVLLHIGTRYALYKALDWLEKKLRSGYFPDLPTQTKEFLLKTIPILRQCITILHRCHLAVFYLYGTFYHMAKRIAGVRYLQYQVSEQPSLQGPSFRLLGYLSLAQLAGSLGLQVFQFGQRHLEATKITGGSGESETLNEKSGESTYVPNVKRCSLCLEARDHPTATPCGHLFCWDCIHEWCKTKAECPLCRDKFSPSRLICLQNYD